MYIIDTGVMASHNDFVEGRTEQLENYTDDNDKLVSIIPESGFITKYSFFFDLYEGHTPVIDYGNIMHTKNKNRLQFVPDTFFPILLFEK